MTFARPLAIHVRQLSGTTNVYDFMADLYSLWNGTSTVWQVDTATKVDTTSPALTGGYSFKITPLGGGAPDIEINFRNAGTPGSPSTQEAHIGINPDGSGDPILDTTDPSNSAINYSAYTSHGPAAFLQNTTVSQKYMIAEFEDAIVVFLYDAAETYMPRGFAAGRPVGFRWTDDPDGDSGDNEIRVDGLVVQGYLPSTGSGGMFYSSTNTRSIFRRSLGATVGTGETTSWVSACYGWVGTIGHTIDGTARAAHMPAAPNINFCPHGEHKYFKSVDAKSPFTIRSLSGVDYLMHVWSTNSTTRLALHIVDGFLPKTVGVYT